MSGVRWKKLACGGDQPEPRWGHTSSQWGTNIVIIGGTGSKLFNDVCVYDTARNTWMKPEVRGTSPTPRLGHSTTTLPDGKLLVFGGRSESKHYSDIHVFDPSRLAWVRSAQSPKSYPESRAGHTAILTPDQTRIVLFGGTSAHYKYFSNAFTLDIATLVWTKQDTKGEAPPKRGGHCAFLAHNKMFIFGGFDGKKYYNDLYSLSLDTFVWSRVEASGLVPKPRSGHTATLTNGGTQLVVFGGCGANSDFLSDVHVLRLADMHWSQPKCLGTEPHPRFRHTCSEVGNLLYIFSGTGSGNLLSDTMQLEFDAAVPSPSPSLHATSMQHIPQTQQHLQLQRSQSQLHIPEPEPAELHLEPHSESHVHPTTTTTTTTTTINTPQHPRPTTPQQIIHTPSSSTHHIPSSTPPSSTPPPSTPPSSTSPPSFQSSTPEKDINPVELRRLYVAAMMALKAEKQQREDFEMSSSKFERELGNIKHQVVVEKTMRVAAEDRLLDEHRLIAKLEQTTNSKIEKVTKKKQKALQSLQDTLTKEQQQHQLLTKQIKELTESLAKEKKLTKELKQSLTSMELRSQEGVSSLTKELEEMKLRISHMQGQELDDLSLEELVALEDTHTHAQNTITHARTRKQTQENETKNVQLQQLLLDNQRLTDGKVEMEAQIRTLTTNLHKCEEALHAQKSENESLRTKASRLEGSDMGNLTLQQLVELENVHHEGLRRVSQLRQEHMQKELEMLRKEKEALQEKQMCIICTEKPCNCVLLPCRHSSMCSSCCALLTRCPICRSEITKRIHTYEK